MIEVPLSETGGFGGYTQFFHGVDTAEDIFIEGCARCLGLVIIWKRKEDHDPTKLASGYAATAFHLPPYVGKARLSKRKIFRLINYLSVCFEPRIIYYCGGKIDTEVNKHHYKRSKRFFLLPFKKLFPKVQLFGLDPTPDQASSTMYVTEELDVVFDKFVYDLAS